jgi:adenylate cyclase, class 2
MIGYSDFMPQELEAKMKVSDLAPVRARLVELGATHIVKRLEVNVFVDSPDKTLLSKDSGLRIRLHANNDGSREIVMTYKGKQVGANGLKNREEIEVVVDDLDRTLAVLSKLGYVSDLRFEKRRESFELEGCRVELDELPPPLGVFVEIEGQTKTSIDGVREKLGLEQTELSTVSYAAMVAKHLKEVGKTELSFSTQANVVALVRDLLFVSKIRAAAKAVNANVQMIRDAGKLQSVGGKVLIITLNEPGYLPHAVEWKSRTGGRVIAFGSHVATESLDEARQLGVDRVLSNGQFSSQIDAILREAS